MGLVYQMEVNYNLQEDYSELLMSRGRIVFNAAVDAVLAKNPNSGEILSFLGEVAHCLVF